MSELLLSKIQLPQEFSEFLQKFGVNRDSKPEPLAD